jgi:hypothetical protein
MLFFCDKFLQGNRTGLFHTFQDELDIHRKILE